MVKSDDVLADDLLFAYSMSKWELLNFEKQVCQQNKNK